MSPQAPTLVAAATAPTPGAGHAWVLPALVCSALVYFPITANHFFSDDFLNLFHLNNDSLGEYLLIPNGGHVLVTRNLIFYLTWRLAGTNPVPYYTAAFLTHLVNVALLFVVVRALTRSARLASFGAALWGICPANEGSLGWYAVYGHVVVASAFLIIFWQAARVAEGGGVPPRWMRWLWYTLALAAMTSFGTGMALAMVLPFALWLLLPAWRAEHRWPPFVSLVIVVPLLYVALTWTYEYLSEDRAVPRTPLSTLISSVEAPVTFWARLVAFGLTRLLFGGFFAPWMTAGTWFAVLGTMTAGVLLGWRRMSPALRRQLGAYVLLILTCYAVIALGRASLLSTFPHDVVPLVPRYHYLGQLLLTIVLCLVLTRAGAVLGTRSTTVALIAWYSLAVFAHMRFGTPIDHHDDARATTMATLSSINDTILATPAGQPAFIHNKVFHALPFFPHVFPGWAAVFVIFQPENTVFGHRVYFIERHLEVIRRLERGKRTAGLLVLAPPHPTAGVAPPP